MILEKISSLMISIDRNKPDSFTGIGLIFYDNLDTLPIASLKLPHGLIGLPIEGETKILTVLLEIAKANHYYHDGFHLVNQDFTLTHLSQYVAAPVIQAPNVEFEYGSRYRTAFYASFLSGVLACCVVSNDHGPVVFTNGKKVNPYEIKHE